MGPPETTKAPAWTADAPENHIARAIEPTENTRCALADQREVSR